MVKEKKGNGDNSLNENVTFHYIKSNSFRVIHVDGCIGSLTPGGSIHASMFSERPAIPRELTYELKDDGTLGDLKESVSKIGFVREMDVDLLMNLGVAKDFHKWLGDKITELEGISAKRLKVGEH